MEFENDVYDVYDQETAETDEELNDGLPYVAIETDEAGIAHNQFIKDELVYDEDGYVYDRKSRKRLGKIAKFAYNPIGATVGMGKKFFAKKKNMKKARSSAKMNQISGKITPKSFVPVNTAPIAGAGTVLDGILDKAMDRMVQTGKIIMPLDPEACDVVFTSNALLHKYETKEDMLKAMDSAVQGANNKSYNSQPYVAGGLTVTIPIAPAVNTMAAVRIRFADSFFQADNRGVPVQINGTGVDPVDFILKPKKPFFEVLLLSVSLAQGFANVRPCTVFNMVLGAGVARVGSNWELESINARDLGTKR